MDIFQIKNDFLQVNISSIGAEIQSIYGLKQKKEYIWAGESDWKQHFPILFPIVGQLKDNSYQYKGKTYVLPRHGFAQHSLFTAKPLSNSHICFILTASDKTLQAYPFHFELEIHYSLHENQLSIQSFVRNLSESFMFYSFGLHPGFTLEANQHYFLQFSEDEELITTYRPNIHGLCEAKRLTLGKKNLSLSPSLFVDRALIFTNLKSNQITLCNKNSTPILSMDWDGIFDILGIWSTNTMPFICIEPWAGHSDLQDSTSSDLEQKPSIRTLAPSAETLYSTNITFMVED